MAGRELPPVDDDVNLDRFAKLEKTLNQILMEIQKLSRDDHHDQVQDVDEFESCIRIRGRPILPPVMTPERRKDCRKWKSEALEVETRLAEQRRQKIFESIEVGQDGEEELFVMMTGWSSDEKVNPAFKTPVGCLKQNSGEKETELVPSSPQFESLSSEATVVEKTSQDHHDDDVDSSTFDTRSRKGSYTLDHPSPSLVAYMKKAGKSKMESPRPRSVLSSRPPAGEAPQHLDNYLSELSQMPEIKISTDTPIVNPPTPFRSTSESTRNENVTKLSFEYDSDISSDETSPQSVTSPRTARTSVIDSFLPTEPRSEPDQAAVNNLLKDSNPVRGQTNLFESSTKDSTTAVIDPPTFRSNVDHETSLASSLQESVTIRTSVSNATNDFVVKVSTPNKADEAQKLEAAVCSLALRQDVEIRKLMEHQEREREAMKKMFDEQRRQLVEEIMQQVKAGPSRSSTTTLQPPSFQAAASPTTSTAMGRTSPIIPTCVNKFRPPEESLKQLPQDFRVPDVVYTPQMKYRFDRLSALVKGYLTRRLLKTERVQRIISSMRDTMTIALQLHREAKTFIQGKGNVSVQDIELHRRLLQQIFKDSQSIHNIFFNISIGQRMAIIRQDREIRQERSLRGEDPDPPKRISAVTKARMQQKTQIQAMLIQSEAAVHQSNSPKVTSSQERPWRQKHRSGSPTKPKGVRPSVVSARRSLNLNENRPRSESGTSRSTPQNRKSRPSSTSSNGNSALTLHNKPWK